MATWSNPLHALDWVWGHCQTNAGDGPPFKGGWIGWFSYDLGRLFERIPALAIDDLGLPLFELSWHDRAHIHDRVTGTWFECTCESQLSVPKELTHDLATADSSRLQRQTPCPPMSRRCYIDNVKRALEYIRAGDIFQVNLARRISQPTDLSAALVHERLFSEAPSWMGACLNYTDYALVSSSPELFLRVDRDPTTGQRWVRNRPIKGTRARKSGLENELRYSPKDQAELNMIVDLQRNDLGRVCRIGSVVVEEPRTIEEHPTVFHGVSTVRGILNDGVGLAELLRATFPCGSVTGAPKVRAMQIIEELEPVRRGAYCGAIGFLSVDGAIQLNVAIRTIVLVRGTAHVSVGAGIVAESDPAAEYEETCVKASAMLRALNPA
jgi:anthranilate/para-aminobenzoate synthase component I